jgi:hypothetical protein
MTPALTVVATLPRNTLAADDYPYQNCLVLGLTFTMNKLDNVYE